MIYVRVNKAGSTSVSKLVEGHCTILQFTSLGKRANRLAGWMDKESIKNELCFTVVRNPFDRAISQWQHCKRLGFDYSFQEWLEKDFCEMEPVERAHSLRQVDFLFDTTNSIEWVDYIFKLERKHLGNAIKELTGATGTLKHLAKGDYDKMQYSGKCKELVSLKYYLDFKLLDYDDTRLPR